MISRELQVIVLAFLVTLPMRAFADHPNEGSLTLTPLIEEAAAQNLELKEAEASYKSSQARARASFGRFLPSIAVEGGPLVTKLNDEKNSGTTYYGRLDWNLYRGGTDQYGFQSYRLREELENRKYQAAKARVSREVSRAYYELLFLLESSALKEKAIELNQEQMKLAKLKNSSGFTSSVDVIEFELREATLSSDLKMIGQQVLEKSRELAVILGRKDLSSPLLVKGHLAKPVPPISKDQIMQQLDERNIGVATARAELELSKNDLASVKSRYLPTIDIDARYGKFAVDERVLSDANNYSVFLRFSIPLFSGLETVNESRAARANTDASEKAAARTTLAARAAAENTFSRLNTLSERIALEEKTLAKSETYYKLTLGEYRRGVKNSPDMVVASERLLEARIRNLEFRRDFYLAELQLNELTSTAPIL